MPVPRQGCNGRIPFTVSQEVHFLSRIHMVAGLNFCVNGLLLAGTGCMTGRDTRLWRLLAAAALGAVHAAVCFHPDCRFLGALPWRVLILTVMALLAFGLDARAIGTFLLVTLALGSAVREAGRGGWWQLAATIAGIFWLTNRAPRRRLIPVEIIGQGKTIHLHALYDTGNELRDPVTGESVLVIGSPEAKRLTGLTKKQLAEPLKTMEQMPLPGLRLVPFRAVGAEHGLLLAMRFRRVRVGRRRGDALVAFAPQSFGTEYQALAGGTLC